MYITKMDKIFGVMLILVILLGSTAQALQIDRREKDKKIEALQEQIRILERYCKK